MTILLLPICFTIPICNAQITDVVNTEKPANIQCPDNVRVYLKANTFDDPAYITCTRENQADIENLISPIYKISIKNKKDDKDIVIFRNEAELYIPKEIITNEEKDIQVFFFDKNQNDWISYNTISNNGNYIKSKFMYASRFAVFNKDQMQNRDSYYHISFNIFILGICLGLIYVIIKK